MPIDSFILEPMISPYENMVKDVDARGLTGPDVDALKAALGRIKELGQEHSDIGSFTGACMQENLYTVLSDHYSKALSAETSAANTAGPDNYDDAALLKQVVNSLRSAIDEINRAKKEALEEAAADPKRNLADKAAFASRFGAAHGISLDAGQAATSMSNGIDKTLAEKPMAFDNTAEVEALDISADIIPAIEELIQLGESPGMTLPDFLRIQIEKGLDKATEGAVATRKGLVYSQDWAKASAISPFHIDKAKEDLHVFDALAAKQKFGVPNWTELKWAHQDVKYKYEPDQIKWGEITDRWESILSDLSFWALAHCSFAPYVEPWSLMDPPKRPPSIRRVKYTQPGIIKEKERLLQKYFNISFDQIFDHPTFKWAVEHKFISYSKEYIEFLRTQVYPNCIPCQLLPDQVVKQKEELYQGKREANPEGHFPAIRIQQLYDQKFGTNRYVSKFGQITPVESNAAPW